MVGPSVNDSLVDASVQRVGENETGESYNPGRPESLPSRGTVALDVDRELAVRIGLSQVRGLGAAAKRIVDARRQGASTSSGRPRAARPRERLRHGKARDGRRPRVPGGRAA